MRVGDSTSWSACRSSRVFVWWSSISLPCFFRYISASRCLDHFCTQPLRNQSCTYPMSAYPHPSLNKDGPTSGGLPTGCIIFYPRSVDCPSSTVWGKAHPVRRAKYLNHSGPHLLPGLAQTEGHVLQQRRMADVAGEAVASDVRGPLEAGGVGVAGADVARLELLQLLLRAELVGLAVSDLHRKCCASGCLPS